MPLAVDPPVQYRRVSVATDREPPVQYRRGSGSAGERGPLLVLLPGDVPVAVAVGRLHLPVGAGVVDDVAPQAHVVEPVGVRGAHARAAVGDVGVALGADRPRGRVDELAGV